MDSSLTLAGVIGIVAFVLLCVFFSLAMTIAPFALLGGFFYSAQRRSEAERAAAQAWHSTTGRIVKSRVEVRGGDHTSVTPMIRYEYTVNGHPYQSTRFRVGLLVLKGSEAYEIVDRYPEGASVTVYYDPSNPAEASLER